MNDAIQGAKDCFPPIENPLLSSACVSFFHLHNKNIPIYDLF